MKITIDTQKDSEEEIRHAIAMLQTVVGKSEASTIISPASPVSESQGIFSLFDEKTETESNDDEEETVVIEEDPNKDVEVQIVTYD